MSGITRERVTEMREAGAISRRAFTRLGLGAMAAPALIGCGPHKAVRSLPGSAAQAAMASTEAGPGTSLKAAAATRNMLYGCAVDMGLLRRDEAYSRLIVEQADIVVAENAMKWASLRPGVEAYDFDTADAFVAFAGAHGMKVRGHNLCWHRQLPTWFASQATTANARELLRSHIQTVAGRYAGRMHSWDVVNEAVLVEDGRPDGLRDSPWLRLVGEDYIELAFRTAREADPEALLTYNEYGIEGQDEGSRRKRIAMLSLLRRLKARRAPVDAVGLQAHLTAGHRYGDGVSSLLSALRELGLQVFVTEMDVNDRELPADVAVRDEGVAKTYAEFMQAVVPSPALHAVLTWGITDRRTWLNSEDARPDHLPERCLPFGLLDGREDQPKKAFFAIRKAFGEGAC